MYALIFLLLHLKQIHVDKYKHGIYTHTSDRFLRSIITLDAASTRFHACERFARCSWVNVGVKNGGRGVVSVENTRVVYVNPVTAGNESWNLYSEEVKKALKEGSLVDNLVSRLYA